LLVHLHGLRHVRQMRTTADCPSVWFACPPRRIYLNRPSWHKLRISKLSTYLYVLINHTPPWRPRIYPARENPLPSPSVYTIHHASHLVVPSREHRLSTSGLHAACHCRPHHPRDRPSSSPASPASQFAISFTGGRLRRKGPAAPLPPAVIFPTTSPPPRTILANHGTTQ
jgi:hypothetical protein